ncbi:MAG TPA: hypothetical protein ENI77_12370 [Nitrospirae bacterium]|nr:hypothetical protein [Nitrospirota bacterium]
MRIIYSVVIAVAIIMSGSAPGSQYGKIDKIKEQIIEIQNSGELGVRNLTLCRKIIGYGVYIPYTTNVTPKGAVIYFYSEVENIFTSKSKDGYAVNFSQDVILVNSKGKELLNMPKAIKFNYSSVKPVLNLYITFKLNLSSAAPGDYIYKIVLYDELRGAKVKAEYPFTIK